MNNKNENLIIDIISDFKILKMTGNPIIDEYFLWKELKYDNLLEIDDLNIIKQEKNRQLKTLSLTLIMSVISVKIVNILDFKRPLRFVFKISLFTSIFYFKFVLQFLNNFMILHKYMNNKYYNRYKEYLKIGDPIIMNTKFYNHESLSEDERSSLKLLYDKLKYKQECVIKKEMQSKLIIEKIEEKINKKYKL